MYTVFNVSLFLSGYFAKICVNLTELILQRALFRLAVDVGEGKWTEEGIPKGEKSTEEQLQVSVSLLRTFYLPKIKMEELYTVDVESATGQFEKRLRSAGRPCKDASQRVELKLVQDPGFRRLRSSVDLDLAVQIFNANHNDICDDEERRIARCCSEFKKRLEQLNESAEIKCEFLRLCPRRRRMYLTLSHFSA